MKRLYRQGTKFGDWTLTSFLGGGGNGEVWTCKNSKGEINAIKLLKKVKPKPYSRFIDETRVIEQNSDIVGIIPIIEKHLPENLRDHTPYFVMPLAETSEKKLQGLPTVGNDGGFYNEYESELSFLVRKIDGILQVAETLSELHKRKIYHRDIKPANILYYNGRFSLADFGLVDYPNKKEISLKNEEIGAKWTMAPEMRRESTNADAAKADIYSLAKTLWIYLTGNNKGFDGQYSTESIIHLKKFYPKGYTSPIDNLLLNCTDNDPTKRPTIEEFIFALHEWKQLAEDFHERNLEQWFEIQSKLFPTSIPKRVVWEDINDIIKVLKVVCTYDNLNHLFMPSGGGLDLEDVRISHEEGCIELDFQLIDIIKPKRLLFESFGYDPEWNYFRLEADELEPSGVYKAKKGEDPYEKTHDREEVTQVYPGHYEDYNYLENSYYREQDDYEYERPQGMKHVTRWFRGSFVIFCKRSVYNRTSSTYDGRHNKMTTDEFRDYIQRSVDHFKEEVEKIPLFEKIFSKPKKRQHKTQDKDEIADF